MSRPFNGILVSQVGSLSLGQEEGSPALYQWHKVLIDCYAVACFVFILEKIEI